MSRSQSWIRVVLATSMVVLAASACAMEDAGMASSTMQNVPADASGPGVPEGVAQFAVDPFWPKPLPNNWILGQVAGTAIDRDDNLWISHRPWSVQGTNAGSTPPQSTRDQSWGSDPVQSLCCTTAPPVFAFDPEGTVIPAWGGDSPTGDYQCFTRQRATPGQSRHDRLRTRASSRRAAQRRDAECRREGLREAVRRLDSALRRTCRWSLFKTCRRAPANWPNGGHPRSSDRRHCPRTRRHTRQPQHPPFQGLRDRTDRPLHPNCRAMTSFWMSLVPS